MHPTAFHFLSALGSAILNNFWQMALLWLLVIAISRLNKKISPQAMSLISFVALTVGFAAFIGNFVFLWAAPKAESKLLFARMHSTHFIDLITRFSAILYLALLSVPMIKLFIAAWQIRNLRRSGLKRPPGRYKLFLIDAAAYLGIRKNIVLKISNRIDTPMTIGFLKPLILLPLSLITQLNPTQVEAVLLHELAHIRRHDYLLNLAAQCMISILYFNPFAKALLYIMQTEREKTADHWVLRFDYNHQMYAATLLQIAHEQLAPHMPMALYASGKKMPLYHRIQWIMGIKERYLPSAKKTMLTFFVSALLFLLSLIARHPTSEPVGTVAAMGNISVMNVDKFAINVNPSKAPEIMPIPAIETDKSLQKNLVYLNQNENTKTGEAEITLPPAPTDEPPYLFAAHPVTLTQAQEEKVQQHLEALKKIIAENMWKEIENRLAESVTEDQKVVLKDYFTAMLQSADWKEQADNLRQAYDSINWEQASDKINLELLQIRLDSVYQHYARALEEYKKEEARYPEKTSQAIKEKILLTEIILQRADSLRRKKIVEL